MPNLYDDILGELKGIENVSVLRAENKSNPRWQYERFRGLITITYDSLETRTYKLGGLVEVVARKPLADIGYVRGRLAANREIGEPYCSSNGSLVYKREFDDGRERCDYVEIKEAPLREKETRLRLPFFRKGLAPKPVAV